MFADFLISECTIKRPSFSNERGIKKTEYVNIGSVNCSLHQLSGNEVLQNEKLNYKTTHRVYLLPPSTFEIRNGDVMTINGINYEVKILNNPMELNKLLQIDCEFRSELQ